MVKLEKRKIGDSSLEIGVLGLGCAPLGGNFVDLDYAQGAGVISAAYEAGLRLFDTAPWYGFGRSERIVGDLLRGKDCIISSKVGRILKAGAVKEPSEFGMVDPLPFHPIYDYSYDGIMRAYEDSLQRMGIEKIDVLLIHDIGKFQHGEKHYLHFKDLEMSGYKAMSELRRNGNVKAIGLGGKENEVCSNALKIGDWDVFLLAGRYTLLDQTSLDELMPICENNNISLKEYKQKRIRCAEDLQNHTPDHLSEILRSAEITRTEAERTMLASDAEIHTGKHTLEILKIRVNDISRQISLQEDILKSSELEIKNINRIDQLYNYIKFLTKDSLNL